MREYVPVKNIYRGVYSELTYNSPTLEINQLVTNRNRINKLFSKILCTKGEEQTKNTCNNINEP